MSDVCTEIAKFGKSIGNESRYRIVQELLAGAKSVNELVVRTGLSQPLVSQHLKLLKENNLVHDDRQGKEVVYTINSTYMLQLLKKISSSVDGKKCSVRR